MWVSGTWVSSVIFDWFQLLPKNDQILKEFKLF